MGSAHTNELALLIRERVPDRAELRPRLLRLTSAVEERVLAVDATSIDFVRNAVRILGKLGPTYYPEIQFRCLSSAAPFLYAHAELDVAIAASRAMVAIGKHTGQKKLTRKGSCFLGAIEKSAGNFTDAISHLYEALRLAQETSDVSGEIAALGNLGATFFDAALYCDALPCFQRVELLCATCGVRNAEIQGHQAMNLVNMSSLLLRMGDSKGAYDAAQKSLLLWEEPVTLNDYVSRTLRKAHYVYLCLERGAAIDAKSHAEDCQRYAAEGPTATTRLFAKIATGLVEVELGDAHHGLELLESARVACQSTQLTCASADSWIALAWAYERLHRPEEALSCLRALRGYIVENRKRGVMALIKEAPCTRVENDFDLMAMNYREARLEAEAAKSARQEAQIDLLQRLAIAATLRDDPSGMHGHRVGRLSALIAAKLGWDAHRCWALEIAARLHDIGKSGLPDHILLRRDVLKEAEREFIRAHSRIGHTLLANAPCSEVPDAAAVALHHHERWDGTGYPKGLRERQIPLVARIVAIADVFDALTHGRPYSDAWQIDKALTEILRVSGSHFDPEICSIFADLVYELRRGHDDLDAYLTKGAEESPFMAARRNIEQMLGQGLHRATEKA